MALHGVSQTVSRPRVRIAKWTLTITGAPFSLVRSGFRVPTLGICADFQIGELILIDGQIDRTGGGMALAPIDRPSLDETHRSPVPPLPPPYSRTVSISAAEHAAPILSRHNSARSSIEHKLQRSPPTNRPGGMSRSLSRQNPPTPLRVHQLEQSGKLDDLEDDDASNENSLVLHHSDDEETDLPPRSPLSPSSPRAAQGKSTADKAGVILGIHNVFVVLPQFLVTGLSSVIFSIMEPDKGIPATHPNAGPPIGNATAGVDLGLGADVTGMAVRALARRAETAVEGASSDAVGLIFR